MTEPARVVLFVTHSADNDLMLPMLARAVEARGARVVVLNTDLYPTEHKVSQYGGPDGDRFFVDVGLGPIELTARDVVWIRRLRIAKGLPGDMDPLFRQGAVGESEATLQGFLSAVPSAVLDPFHKAERADRKAWQHRVATAVGLRTPRTLITNDPAAAAAFAATCPHGVVAKMQSVFTRIDEHGQEQAPFTTLLDASALANLASLRLGPLVLQEFLPKAAELRVTVVGTRVFSARLDTPQHEGAEVDWRQRGIALVTHWHEHALPADLERRLVAFLDHTGLQYSAADFIVTPEGEHVFLEANPVGEFFWLQCNPPHFPMTEALADLLTDAPGARRPLP